MSFIAIDLGTSFIKAAVLDLESFSLQNIRRIPFPDPISGLDPLKVEFDCGTILAAVKQLLSELQDDADQCEGIVLCTQMSCLVMMDEQGHARSNCIGWRDQRALEPYPSGEGSYYDELKRRISPQQRRELGNELPTGAPISFLFWMAEKHQLEPGLIPASLADFVLSTLCRSQPTVESTNAMAYELLDLTRMQWHQEVIEELGLGKLRWPTILQHGQIVGHLKLGEKEIPCYTAVGDYQCALAGAFLTEKELSLNVSTGSQVSRLTKTLLLGDYQTRPFFDGKYTNTLSHLPAGRSLNVLVDLVTEFANAQNADALDPWQYIAKAATSAAETDLQVNLGFFPGPCGNDGAIANIREKNLNVGSLFRAAFENMAENYANCADRVWPEHEWRNIVFSGGVARKLDQLRALIEARLQTKSRLCQLEEDTLLGLMVLALVFSQRTGTVEQAMSQLSAHFARLQ
ncbi:MAG TPA: FGGY family carbohydrate kinase [Terriglobales bacterium]|nr:FGGY family carbohydrate kinase [Terriglobales bacterium]